MPKETGREAMLEKRKQKGAYARNSRGDDGGQAEVSESVLMGGSGVSDFQRMLANRKAGEERRAESARSKAEEYRAKEEERMKKLLDSMGLKKGQWDTTG